MLVTTPAIVLHAFPYGESSKIVRLVTPEHGVLSAIAKGVRRPKSRFGARLQLLSEGVAQVYVKQNRDLHTLAEFDVTAQRPELSQDVARYAAASALAELVMRCVASESNPHIFALIEEALVRLVEVDPVHFPAASLAAVWRIVCALGFAPAIHECAVDGRMVEPGGAAFSVIDGGFVCAACARTRETSKLGVDDRAILESFVSGAEPDAPVPPRHAKAHRRLLARFIRQHVAENRDLRALDFWEAVPWPGTS
jgi:DNA repair protein RecO (recombination protein O)